MNHDAAEDAREEATARCLVARGWRYMGNWRFRSPRGTIHDMSAADVSQADRIEQNGLFLLEKASPLS